MPVDNYVYGKYLKSWSSIFFVVLINFSHAQDHMRHASTSSSLVEKKKDEIPYYQMLQDTKHDTSKKMMHGMYGNYSMTREASGTSWVPTSSPQEGFHLLHNHWMFMFNGFSYFVMDVQRGKEGNEALLDENMFMFMAQRDFEKYTFAFRSMFSLEPLTIGKCGYPLLFQTGETCDGEMPLINRQHPHDLFMELALVNTYRITENNSLFLYLALPGEPALGPPVFMMRFSSEYIPEAPLGHHWMDSTHITFGVVTAGFIYKGLKLEGSVFNGREPDQDRFNIERPKLNSYSVRFSLNPTENLAFQASYGFLKSPEHLHPDTNINRYIISAIYNKNFHNDSNFQGSAIVGFNNEKPGKILPAFLLEGTVELRKKHLFFSRFEWVKKDDLFIEPDVLADKAFDIKKLTTGYVYEFLLTRHSKWGVGGLLDFPITPKQVSVRYGDAISYMFFFQIRLI